MISHIVTSHLMYSTRLRQFKIIIYLEIDLSLIIHYLTYRNFFDQLLELTFSINLH